MAIYFSQFSVNVYKMVYHIYNQLCGSTSLLLGDVSHLSYTVLDDIQDIDASSFRNATRAKVKTGNSLGYDLDTHICSVC